jgi:hypothetical protein
MTILAMILRHSGSEFWVLDRDMRHQPQMAPFTTGMNIAVKWHDDVIEILDTRHGYTNNYLMYLNEPSIWKQITNLLRYERSVDIYIWEPTIGRPKVKMDSFLTSRFDQPVEFEWHEDMVPTGWTSIIEVVISENVVLITFSYPKGVRTIEFPRMRQDS